MIVACDGRGQGHQKTFGRRSNVLYLDGGLGDRCMQLSKLSKCTLTRFMHFIVKFYIPRKKTANKYSQLYFNGMHAEIFMRTCTDFDHLL